MSRVRSPNFPVIGLKEAIARVQVIFEREHQMPAAREALASHLGYSGLNGTSLKVISALGKFDLLEEVGDQQFRVSDIAMDIMHGDEGERAAAIREAASAPALFARLDEHFGGGVPSEVNLKGFLLRNGFSQSAVSGVIDAYRETKDLVASLGAQYSEEIEQPIAPVAGKSGESAPAVNAVAPALNDKPFAVEFVPGGVRINADIRDQETLSQLVKALQALAGFLRPTKDVADSESPPAS